MTRQALIDFIHSVQHSSSLRERINACRNYEDIIKLALEYRFNISIDDIKEDDIALEINKWFKASKIKPIKK